MARPAPDRLLLQPFAWLQSLLWGRALKRLELPDDSVIVIAHWRSSNTGLHQLLAANSGMGSSFACADPLMLGIGKGFSRGFAEIALVGG